MFCFASYKLLVSAGLKVQPFKGLDSIQEIECTGKTLLSDTTLLAMTLFREKDSKLLAYLNLQDNQCSTFDVYSACVIDSAESRRTRITSLVTELTKEESSMYRCNITAFRSGKTYLVSWSTPVRCRRK